VPFGERNETQVAGPEYSVNYDSEVIRKRVTGAMDWRHGSVRSSGSVVAGTEVTRTKRHQEGYQPPITSITGSKRILKPEVRPDEEQTHCDRFNHHMESSKSAVSIDSQNKPAYSVEWRKVRTRKHPVTILDASCYKQFRKPMIADLNPASVDRRAKCKIFDNLYAVPRAYQSRELQSRVSSRIKGLGM
jgi:hypothetical protein